MSLESNKQLCRDYFTAFLAGDTAWMERHISPSFVRHDPGLPFEVQIRGGMLIEHWALLDNLGMLKQLGAIPA